MVWYQLKVRFVTLSNKQHFDLGYLIEKDELYVSPHVKLSGDKAAMIDCLEVAEVFREKCLPIFRNRYGVDTEIIVIEFFGSSATKKIKRIKDDTLVVSLRIKQGNFSPNKSVYSN